MSFHSFQIERVETHEINQQIVFTIVEQFDLFQRFEMNFDCQVFPQFKTQVRIQDSFFVQNFSVGVQIIQPFDDFQLKFPIDITEFHVALDFVHFLVDFVAWKSFVFPSLGKKNFVSNRIVTRLVLTWNHRAQTSDDRGENQNS